MVLMALDHVRHFFSDSLAYRPTNLEQNTDGALFVVRWVTHFCAPVFVLLAGTSAYLSGVRRGSKGEVGKHLFKRGVWLIVLELTVVRCLGWTFNFDYTYTMGAVLWALGWSMIVLSGLIYLPLSGIAIVGGVMVAGHHLLDGVSAKELGALGWVWKILHQPGNVEIAKGYKFKVAYPLIPWPGVMALGYVLGACFSNRSPQTSSGGERVTCAPKGPQWSWLFWGGLGMTVGFVALRLGNFYGDPEPWQRQGAALFTVFSFLNCTKYPPSLLFLLMTLGPALMFLGWLNVRRLRGPAKVILLFGRVPLFFYLVHLPLIHGLAVVFSWVRHGEAWWLFANPPLRKSLPEGYGYSVGWVCLLWMLTVIALFPLCQWFARYKRKASGPSA